MYSDRTGWGIDWYEAYIAELEAEVERLNEPVLKSEWQEKLDRIAELEGWIDDCLQLLTGDDDMCAALNHLEGAAQPQLRELTERGEALLTGTADKGE